MALRFNKVAAGGATNDVVQFTVSSAIAALDGGPLTIIMVVKLNTTGAGAYSCPLYTQTSTGTSTWWLEADVSAWNYGTGTTARGVGTASSADAWTIFVARKDASGSFQPVGRKYIFSTATDGGNVTAASTLVDGSAVGVAGVLQIGRWGTTATDYSTMDVAAAYVFGSYLSDATVAAFLAAPTHTAALALTPTWAVRTDNTTSITDLSGNGGGSSAITGTSVVADPAGYFGGSTVTGTATLTAAPTLTAGGTAVKSGTAPLTSSPTLTAAALAVAPATTQLAAAPTLIADGTPVRPATAALTAAPTLTAAGTAVALAVASLTAAPTLTAAAVRDQPVTATLAASPTLTAAGTTTALAVAALTAAPVLTTAALGGNDAAVALTVAPTLTVAAIPGRPAAVVLAATPVLLAAGHAETLALVALAASPALTAAATRFTAAAVTLTARPVLLALTASGGGVTRPAAYIRTRTTTGHHRASITTGHHRTSIGRPWTRPGTHGPRS